MDKLQAKLEIIQAENILLSKENVRLHKLLLLSRQREILQDTAIAELQKTLRELLARNGNGLEQKNRLPVTDGG